MSEEKKLRDKCNDFALNNDSCTNVIIHLHSKYKGIAEKYSTKIGENKYQSLGGGICELIYNDTYDIEIVGNG